MISLNKYDEQICFIILKITYFKTLKYVDHTGKEPHFYKNKNKYMFNY
jgi:hypothetical protein